MKVGQASPLQIAFFTFALLLLAVPASDHLVRLLGVSGDTAATLTKAVPFAMFVAAVALFPPLRRSALGLLKARIPAKSRAEVATIAAFDVTLAFASVGFFVSWIWMREGPAGVDQAILVDTLRDATRALSTPGFVRQVLLAGLVAPVVEEIIFRGFLYRAIEARWGWFAAMILSSALFGLYHPHFHAAFLAGILFACVLRRTGSLWSSIVVHAFGNLMFWWPLAGRFVFPTGTASDPWTWSVHIACMGVTLVALPVYVWMSRDRSVPSAPTMFLEPHAALPK